MLEKLENTPGKCLKSVWISNKCKNPVFTSLLQMIPSWKVLIPALSGACLILKAKKMRLLQSPVETMPLLFVPNENILSSVYDNCSYSLFILLFQAHLPEADSPAVSYVRLQTPCYHSSAALRQPGSHQGTSVCLLSVFLPLMGFHHLSFCLNPALLLSLVMFFVFFLPIRKGFPYIFLKHF